MATSCYTCGATWTGARLEHCSAPGCHKTFTNTRSGDKHRTGEHHIHTGPDRRRCMSTWEMEAAGMVQNSLGHWMSSARTPIPGSLGLPEIDAQGEGGGLVQCGDSEGSQKYPLGRQGRSFDGHPSDSRASTQYGSEVE